MSKNAQREFQAVDRWGRQQWIPLSIATLFFLLSLVFSIWAFTLACLTSHQQWILNIFLPLLAALAASFAGGSVVINARGRIDGWTVVLSAAGGLTVWLILFYTSPKSSVCSARAAIVEMAFLDHETIQVTAAGERSISSLRRNALADKIDFKNGRERLFIYGLAEVDENILIGQNSTLEASVVVKFGDRTTIEQKIWELSYLSQWEDRPLIKAIGIDRVKIMAGMPRRTRRLGAVDIPILAVVSCLNRDNWPGGDGQVTLRLTVKVPSVERSLPMTTNQASGTCTT